MKHLKFRKRFLAPVNYRSFRKFRMITVEGYHYCESHNFWFNIEEQKLLQYDGKPCIYTDSRYVEGYNNFYGKGGIRVKLNSKLKSILNIVKKTHNLPKGIKITLENRCYRVLANGSASLDVILTVTEENNIETQYEFHSGFEAMFENDDYGNQLLTALRSNGFSVEVFNNIETSAIHHFADSAYEDVIVGQVAIAHGHNKRIGFSSGSFPLMGYHNGCDKVLWDFYHSFNKWSDCNEIKKGTSVVEVVAILLQEQEVYE